MQLLEINSLYFLIWTIALQHIVLGAEELATPITPSPQKKILAIFIHGTKSHRIAFDPLFYKLAERGHDVTILTSHKSSSSSAQQHLPGRQVREVIGPSYDQVLPDFPNPIQMRLNGSKILDPVSLLHFADKMCSTYYELARSTGLMSEKFDLVMIDAICQECYYGLVHHFNTSTILLTSMPVPYWISSSFGVPTLPAFTPLTVWNAYTDNMSFFQRVINAGAHVVIDIARYTIYYPTMESFYRRYFPNAPSVSEIQKSASLLMSNRHSSLNYPRPMFPDVIDVAGMHFTDPKPLPKDLEDFVNSSGDQGFIYFSIGSFMNGSQLPQSLQDVLFKTFSKLEQKVLWKLENPKAFPNLPPNIRIDSWFPQQDLLGHPKIRLFISHGGLLSVQETIYHKVPMIGIPIFNDQDGYMHWAESHGFGLTIQLEELTEELLSKTIHRMLKDKRFAQNAQQLSTIFRDDITKPLDRAVYWTEYVLRHNGAPHLASASRHLNFFQYYSLDVAAFFALISCLAVYALVFLLRFIGTKAGFSKSKPIKLKSIRSRDSRYKIRKSD